MSRFKIITFGCKVNQYESAWVSEALAQRQDAEDAASVDLVVVNTCTLTTDSDRKCRKALRHLSSEHPRAELVVMGCYAVRAPDEILAAVPRARILSSRNALLVWLGERGLSPPSGLTQFPERHRAAVKVQDGCTACCAYCIVPVVRPHLLSRPISEVICEVQRLVEVGYREIVLTGIHLGLYGVDLDANRSKQTLTDLVRDLIMLPSDARFRLRLSSIEAGEVSDELIDLMASFPQRLAPHLHLPLQSGSDTVLSRMGRVTSASQFAGCVAAVRAKLPEVAITSDVIVGFPGETDADFAETLALAQQLAFSKIHVFRYSRREGTPAAALRDTLAPIKARRAKELEQLAAQLRNAAAQRRIGKTAEVLVETVHNNNTTSGTSEHYFTAVIESDLPPLGTLVKVTVTGTDGDILLAKVTAAT